MAGFWCQTGPGIFREEGVEMDEVTLLKRCAICPESVIYKGPRLLSNASVFCDATCQRIWDAITPGEWLRASELMPGGCLHNRPDTWMDSLEAR